MSATLSGNILAKASRPKTAARRSSVPSTAPDKSARVNVNNGPTVKTPLLSLKQIIMASSGSCKNVSHRHCLCAPNLTRSPYDTDDPFSTTALFVVTLHLKSLTCCCYLCKLVDLRRKPELGRDTFNYDEVLAYLCRRLRRTGSVSYKHSPGHNRGNLYRRRSVGVRMVSRSCTDITRRSRLRPRFVSQRPLDTKI